MRVYLIPEESNRLQKYLFEDYLEGNEELISKKGHELMGKKIIFTGIYNASTEGYVSNGNVQEYVQKGYFDLLKHDAIVIFYDPKLFFYERVFGGANPLLRIVTRCRVEPDMMSASINRTKYFDI